MHAAAAHRLTFYTNDMLCFPPVSHFSSSLARSSCLFISIFNTHPTKTKKLEQANKRIEIIQYEIAKLDKAKAELQDSDDDSDDDGDNADGQRGDGLNEKAGLLAELKELEQANVARRKKLDEYEKNKKVRTCIHFLWDPIWFGCSP